MEDTQSSAQCVLLAELEITLRRDEVQITITQIGRNIIKKIIHKFTRTPSRHKAIEEGRPLSENIVPTQ